jgi:selenide, water dikinase
LPVYPDPNVLVGYETADDAGVYRLDDESALVQTLDFFTPVVDDPFSYGAIAAANALSDVYAMGGKPLTALAIACFPEKGLDLDILRQIMAGGLEKLREAGVALLGGHTVSDQEIKFGYSITGSVHPGRILTNSGARPGDRLVLTKPLGIGILTSGIKANKTSPDAAREAIRVMSTLNRGAADIMLRYRTHAATDITGNGLLGHAFEMAQGSNVTVRILSAHVPVLPQALELTAQGILPRTAKTTWSMIETATRIGPGVPGPVRNILLDPQTSGGLLIAVDSADLDNLLADLVRAQIQATHVGTVEECSNARIIVD